MDNNEPTYLDRPSDLTGLQESPEFWHGWNACLMAVRGSLEGYPDHGGDVEIMTAVERLIGAERSAVNTLDDLFTQLGFAEGPYAERLVALVAKLSPSESRENE